MEIVGAVLTQLSTNKHLFAVDGEGGKYVGDFNFIVKVLPNAFESWFFIR